MHVTRFPALGVVLLALGGCGVFYTAPSVHDGSVFGDAGTEFDVQVIRMTPESAAAANIEAYVPPRLPLAFQPDAASRAVARAQVSAPQLGPLPQPTPAPQSRPNIIPDRFPPLVEPRPYRIGVADELLLAVNGSTSLEGLPGLITAQNKRQGYIVQDDGAIAIPDAGRVRVAGLTLQDAEAQIFQALVAAGIDPSFSLEIAEFRSQRVSVGGDVGTPSLIPIGLKPLYLHEAVRMAGGARVADPSVAKVQLIRGGTVYQLGLRRFQEDPAAKQIVLMDGDSIFVGTEYREELAQARFQQELQLRQSQISTTDYQFRVADLRAREIETALNRAEQERSLFKDRLELGAVRRAYAYVTGEVKANRRFPLPFEQSATLADALFDKEVGLPIQTADYAEIYVLRSAGVPGGGGLLAFHLDAENAANLAIAARFELRPNDVIFVAEQPITSWNRALSQVVPSLFTSIAVAAGGGL